MTDQTGQVTWRATNAGPVPVSVRYDDPYFSLDNGLAETQHVFLNGNDLPARFFDGFHIAELGFGTGLNFLTTLLAWQESGQSGQFQFTSFEAHPLAPDAAAEALALFPPVAAFSRTLVQNWQAAMRGPVQIGPAVLQVVTGDARATLPRWPGKVDAWFLDGFSPAKNPQMWDPALLQAVGDHTRQGGTCATYTAAGHVRRALADAGFDVNRISGFGRKRHMTQARMPG